MRKGAKLTTYAPGGDRMGSGAMMKRIVLFAFVVAALSGCQPERQDSVPPGTETPGTLFPEVEQIVAPLDIGDIEQGIHFNILLSDRSESAHVSVDAKEDLLFRTKLAHVRVEPPFPEELWFNTTLRCRNDLKGNPVVLRGRYLLDGARELKTFSMIYAEKGENDIELEPVEVLHAYEEPPDSVLLTLEVEALLMPPDTDPATVDAVTATTSPDRISSAMSATVVRIDFVAASESSVSSDAPPVADAP